MVNVTLLGDPENINHWSGTAYYFYKTGKQRGIFDKALAVNLKHYAAKQKWWNIKELLKLNGLGGFQYSDSFLNYAEGQIAANCSGNTIISFSQHFPRQTTVKKCGGEVIYYIDATMQQLLHSKSYNIRLNKRKTADILKLEKENYEHAKFVVTMSEWARMSVINDYGIDHEKVSVIMPGANISMSNVIDIANAPSSKGQKPFVLGFIGKDYERKGLLYLHSVVEILNKRNIDCKIHAIGFDPAFVKEFKYINAIGYVNKHTQLNKFIDFIKGCNLGCLFSADEALGISTLEFLSLGVPVTGFSHQGMADTIKDEWGLRFTIDQSKEEIADILHMYINNEPLQLQKAEHAKKNAYLFSWENNIDKWSIALNNNKLNL